MKKMWAIHVVWDLEQHMRKDNIKLFDTRKEARIAKKQLKTLGTIVKSADIHRWHEDPNTGSFMSKVIYY
ncbi:hypothetical protein CH16_gp071 [Escherichia phage KBNP1711]|uniref:Uncharacterized protein n=1 Tax=Escherichia phage KBNP1711 TaxID=1436889 RepID=W6B250_9CAUD|nr:hypothetical protein CH16_gp071 [Escherichia phage KBNP1711]AHI60848.1 hypothetical protein ECBP3_0071 [Escherichia phage KBNP1711]